VKRLNKIKERADEVEMRELRKMDALPAAEEAGVDGVPESMDYSVRGPRDVVLSGPLLGRSAGPGRMFTTPEEALYWAQDKYGMDRVKLIKPSEEAVRWAVLVKNLKSS
jgi:hypothetical protein